MVKNCRHIEGVAGVSVLLIAQWTLGDTTNLIGSIMTKQLPLQVGSMYNLIVCGETIVGSDSNLVDNL